MSFFLFTWCCLSSMGITKTLQVAYFPVPESKDDTRFDYATQLLKKVLQKTVKSYGPFKMRPGVNMNVARHLVIFKKVK